MLEDVRLRILLIGSIIFGFILLAIFLILGSQQAPPKKLTLLNISKDIDQAVLFSEGKLYAVNQPDRALFQFDVNQGEKKILDAIDEVLDFDLSPKSDMFYIRYIYNYKNYSRSE